MENNDSHSLFKAASDFSINPTNLEEEEDIEEIHRRQEELNDLVAHAFDNLNIEDTRSTFESTYEPNENDDQEHSSRIRESQSFADQYKHTDSAYDQLEVLYKVRVREIEKLTNELTILKEEHKKEKDELSQRVLLFEAENKRASLSLQQCQNLLLEQKEENQQHKTVILEKSQYITKLENEKRNLELEFDVYRTNCQELQQKLNLIERGLNSNVNERQITSRYENEIKNLNLTLENAFAQIDKLESDRNKFSKQIKDLQHEKEMLLIQKNEITVEFSNKLEQIQATSTGLMQKILELEEKNKSLEQQKNVTKQQTQVIQTIVEDKTMVNTLHDELKRALDENKEKRMTIDKLESEVTFFKEKYEKSEAALEEMKGKLNEILATRTRETEEEQNKMHEEIEKFIQVETAKFLKTIAKLEQDLEQIKIYKSRFEGQLAESLNLKDTIDQLNIKLATAENEIAEYKRDRKSIGKPEKKGVTITEMHDKSTDTEPIPLVSDPELLQRVLRMVKDNMDRIYREQHQELVKEITLRDDHIFELSEKCSQLTDEIIVQQKDKERVVQMLNSKETALINSMKEKEAAYQKLLADLHSSLRLLEDEIKLVKMQKEKENNDASKQLNHYKTEMTKLNVEFYSFLREIQKRITDVKIETI